MILELPFLVYVVWCIAKWNSSCDKWWNTNISYKRSCATQKTALSDESKQPLSYCLTVLSRVSGHGGHLRRLVSCCSYKLWPWQQGCYLLTPNCLCFWAFDRSCDIFLYKRGWCLYIYRVLYISYLRNVRDCSNWYPFGHIFRGALAAGALSVFVPMFWTYCVLRNVSCDGAEAGARGALMPDCQPWLFCFVIISRHCFL